MPMAQLGVDNAAFISDISTLQGMENRVTRAQYPTNSK